MWPLGIDAHVIRLVALREHHNGPSSGWMSGKSNMFLVFLLRACTTDIDIQESEIAQCRQVFVQLSYITKTSLLSGIRSVLFVDDIVVTCWSRWMSREEYMDSIATRMKPGTLYHEISKIAFQVWDGTLEGLECVEYPQGACTYC